MICLKYLQAFCLNNSSQLEANCLPDDLRKMSSCFSLSATFPPSHLLCHISPGKTLCPRFFQFLNVLCFFLASNRPDQGFQGAVPRQSPCDWIVLHSCLGVRRGLSMSIRHFDGQILRLKEWTRTMIPDTHLKWIESIISLFLVKSCLFHQISFTPTFQI